MRKIKCNFCFRMEKAYSLRMFWVKERVSTFFRKFQLTGKPRLEVEKSFVEKAWVKRK